ncbi:MAG: nitrate reductase molybdenum cofactor assembly chaperone [Nocardioides sp.]
MSRTLTGRRVSTFTDAQLTVAWQAASLLLGYPDEELLGRLDLVRQASHELPDRVGEPLRACVDLLQATPLTELEADYVETFDTRRRHNLFLTYFAHGDTRKRGMALLRFKQTYLASGFELTDTELPDHLCVVLEYAATIDHEQGRQLLLDHRAGLELLRIALGESGSRWAGAVEAVTATLPPLKGDEWDAVRRLAAAGPPEEEVGLTPYETPAFDPGPARPDGPIQLPMPSFPTRSNRGVS